MKHSYYGRKLGRNRGERRSLFMNLMRSLLEAGRVKTTLAKAKAIQPTVEKLITKAKSGTSSSLRKASATLADKRSYEKLLTMAKEQCMNRTSGHTRIVKLGVRRGDAANMVYLEFVDHVPDKQQPKVSKEKKAVKTDSKVQEAEMVTQEEPKQKKKAATSRRVVKAKK